MQSIWQTVDEGTAPEDTSNNEYRDRSAERRNATPGNQVAYNESGNVSLFTFVNLIIILQMIVFSMQEKERQ